MSVGVIVVVLVVDGELVAERLGVLVWVAVMLGLGANAKGGRGRAGTCIQDINRDRAVRMQRIHNANVKNVQLHYVVHKYTELEYNKNSTIATCINNPLPTPCHCPYHI